MYTHTCVILPPDVPSSSSARTRPLSRRLHSPRRCCDALLNTTHGTGRGDELLPSCELQPSSYAHAVSLEVKTPALSVSGLSAGEMPSRHRVVSALPRRQLTCLHQKFSFTDVKFVGVAHRPPTDGNPREVQPVILSLPECPRTPPAHRLSSRTFWLPQLRGEPDTAGRTSAALQ